MGCKRRLDGILNGIIIRGECKQGGCFNGFYEGIIEETSGNS
jgi:hypothetical protein